MVVAGFLSGGIGSGSLQGAMAGAFSAGAFHGIWATRSHRARSWRTAWPAVS